MLTLRFRNDIKLNYLLNLFDTDLKLRNISNIYITFDIVRLNEISYYDKQYKQ